MVAGTIAVRDLTAADIVRIDEQADRLRSDVATAAEEAGLPIHTSGVGAAFGLYILNGDGEDVTEIDWDATRLLQLAAVNRGIYYGSGGEFGLCTALTDLEIAQTSAGLKGALADVAEAVVDRV
jgi:glutamate-1-semialdehyde aminotransferase